MTYVRICTATDTGFNSEFFYFFTYGFSWAVMVATKRLQLNNAAIMSLVIFCYRVYAIDFFFDFFSIADCYECHVLLNIDPWNTIKVGTSTFVEPIAYDCVVLMSLTETPFYDLHV